MSELFGEDVKTPIAELRKKWRQRNLMDGKSLLKMDQDRLALCVLTILLSSVVFALCILSNGLNRGDVGARNLKYGSIEYGHQKRVLDQLSIIQDEEGNALGGKKAAIQFAHDLRMKSEVPKDEEIINRLSLSLASNIKKIHKNAKAVEPLDVENIKKTQKRKSKRNL